MKRQILKGLALLSILQIIVGVSIAQKTKVTQTLWYDSAAKNWLEALPLGNGTIGAMVFGGVQNDENTEKTVILQLENQSIPVKISALSLAAIELN